VSQQDYEDLMLILNTRLTDYPPTRRIVDFMSYPDTSETDSMGAGELADYLVEYGEPGTTYVHRKSLDYYTDHSEFLVQDWMTPSDITEVTNTRANVNLDFSKSVHLFPATNKHNSSFYISGTIGKLADKSLDLINIVGLRASLGCVTIESYYSGTDHFNRIVASFNNYDLTYTSVLADELSIDTEFSIMLVFGNSSYSAHIVIGDLQGSATFDIENMHIFDLHYLLISPLVANYEQDTIRLHDLRLYGHALKTDGINSVIRGFNQRTI
jgi:hypothetical protein